jgi:signal transduction histidine kinase
MLMLRRDNQQHTTNYPYKQSQQEFHAELRQRMQDHHNYHHGQFLRHYKYFRYLRPVGIVFNIIILYLIFSWAGNKGIGIFCAALILVKEIAQFFFMLRFEKRIIKPMISLKQGLDEVAKGNYQVKIEYATANDLGILIDSFNEMTEKLYESEKIQAEYEKNRKALIANISHDLKTPITAIQGYVEALLDDSINTEEHKSKYMRTIHHNTVYVNKLIDDLFLFAKLDMQKLEFQYQNMKIRAYMDDLMEEYKFDFAEQNIQFQYETQLETDVQVELDGKRFHQAINNIINNANQHGPLAGLFIKVTLYRQNDFVGIDIHDNGSGIPEDKLPLIFDRFYRINNERPKEFAGTGLGLAIAKELIEAHGGEITVSSIENEGSCFTILLPVCHDNTGEVCQ